MVSVPVNNQTTQTIRLAKDQSHRAIGGNQSEVRAQRQGSLEPPAPEWCVERLRLLPRVKPNAKLAMRVDQSPGNEITFVREQIDDVSIDVLAIDMLDRSLKDPRMPPKKTAEPCGASTPRWPPVAPKRQGQIAQQIEDR